LFKMTPSNSIKTVGNVTLIENKKEDNKSVFCILVLPLFHQITFANAYLRLKLGQFIFGSFF
ncbi:hypothetical protein AAUPMC_07637, partial [Pasteurella multocida subsp. multocida str. Anand1_cattle]